MKKVIIALACNFIVVFCFGQRFEWVKPNINYLSSIGPFETLGIVTDNSQNSYTLISYETDSFELDGQTIKSNGGEDLLVVKYDQSGNLLWALSFGSVGWDNNIKDIKIGSSSIYVAYPSYSMPTIFPDTIVQAISELQIAEIDFSGNFLRIIPLGLDCGLGLKLFDVYDDNIFYANCDVAAAAYYIIKINQSGNPDTLINWNNSLPNTNDITNLSCAPNGDLLVSGFYHGTFTIDSNSVTNYPGEWNSKFYIRMDSTGNVIWLKRSNDGELNVSMASDPTGNTYIGTTTSLDTIYYFSDSIYTTPSPIHCFISKLNPAGNILWSKFWYSGGTSNLAFVHSTLDDIYIAPTSEIFVTGRYAGSYLLPYSPLLPKNDQDYLIKFDSNGNKLWLTTFNSYDPANNPVNITSSGSLIYITDIMQPGNSTFGCNVAGPNYGGFCIAAVKDTVAAPPPIVEFTYTQNNQTFYFTNNSTDYDTLEWDFGDGIKSSQINPTHSYASNGTYEVCLTGSKLSDNCTVERACSTVVVNSLYKISPNFSANTGYFIAEITGFNFAPGTTISLTSGSGTVTADSVIFIDTIRALAKFSFINEAIGFKDVEINIPGYGVFTIPNGFDMQQVQEFDPWISVSGSSNILINSWNKLEIKVGNNGNTPVFGVTVLIETKGNKQIQLLNPVDTTGLNLTQQVINDLYNLGSFRIEHDAISGDSTINAILLIPYIPAGGISTISVLIKSDVIDQFEIKTIVSKTTLLPADSLINSLQSSNGNLKNGGQTGIYFAYESCFDCIYDNVWEWMENCGSTLMEVSETGSDHLRNIIDGNYSPWDIPQVLADWGILAGKLIWNCYPFSLSTGSTKIDKLLDKIKRIWDIKEISEDMPQSCKDCYNEAENNVKRNLFGMMTIGSIDPNIKIGTSGLTPQNYINHSQQLFYSVYFENSDSATAPANQVVITDQLDTTNLDLATFRFTNLTIGDSVFASEIEQRFFAYDYDLRPNRNCILRTIFSINDSTGTATWLFRSLNPITYAPVSDPLDGFLPPNVNNPEGEAFVTYHIKSKPALPHNTAINNDADIVFDYNQPIVTPVWTNTIDAVKPQSNVVSLPPAISNDTSFTVHWSGNDIGSGIGSYNIYVSDNDSAYYLWFNQTTDDSAVFSGIDGHKYEFYSIAFDKVGNIEDSVTTHDATTNIALVYNTYYLDSDSDGYGNISHILMSAWQPVGYVPDSTDCNDSIATIYPGAPEIYCNGIDENCNGMADDGVSSTAATSATTDATNDEICAGATVNLTVNGGTLGTSAAWSWHSNSCTGTLVGAGTSISVTPSTTTTYFVKAQGLCNTTPCVQVTLTVKTAPPSANVALPIVNLPAYGCYGVTVSNINIPAVSGATQYLWDGPTGTIFNATSNPYTSNVPNVSITFGNPNGSGYYIGVQASNACGTSARKTQWVRGIVGVPAVVTPASGITTYCANTSATFSCPSVTGATQYLWTITGDATVTGTGTTATVNFGAAWNGGTLCVASQTSCYTSAAKCIALTSSASPIGPIAGTFIACPGQTLAYSVTSVAGASSYNWVLPGGATGTSSTNSINVTFNTLFAGGDIKVQVTSACGVVSAFKSTTIYSGVPPKPSSISGPLNGLCSQTIVYTCPASSGVVYTWTVPNGATINSGQGTNAISVTFGVFTTGTVCVTASTACGTSPARCITVNGKPAVPGAITSIPSSWCANTSGVEFNVDVTPLTGSYTLSWLYPGSSVATYVLGGGNTTSLILNWIAGSGSVNVTSANACGNSTRTSTQANSCKEGLLSTGFENSDIFIYPNPVSDNLTIEYASETNQQVSINLFDATGQVVKDYTAACSIGLNKLQMDISKLAKGIYILDININQKQFKEKVVIN